ncbi:MAG: hypothetical protein JRH20_19295 [Deltaproteobacteria bacterium]|nr:hypothetical protein [Deltaproteobacteria bacterium]
MSRTLPLIALSLLVACGQDPSVRPLRPDSPPEEVGSTKSGKADGFDWGNGCEAGSGTFSQRIDRNKIVGVGTIPAGMVNVSISLRCGEDVDVQLYAADGTALVQWPDGRLNGPGEQRLDYQGVTIIYSGYNGIDGELGHESIRVKGKTASELTMKAYGYAAGDATVDYSWDAADDCEEGGSGEFVQAIQKDAVVDVGVIPAGISNVEIELESAVDIDIQLFDGNTIVVGWPNGLLNGADEATLEHAGVKVTYSGYNGDGTGTGNEFIRIDGTLTRPLMMKVFGYESGQATVRYRWGKKDEAPITAEVIFAPMERHETKVIALITAAEHSLDIAMYNLSDYKVIDALKRAVARGVAVRFIFHKAQADAKAPEGSRSSKLEDAGVDVRFVTKSKIMHHKFMIVDGPRGGADGTLLLDRATTGTLVTGSGNWAGGLHDENTLFLSGVAELTMLYQAEFNELWSNSHDFVWKEFAYEAAVVVDPALIPDDPHTAALFTTANFRTNIYFTYQSGSTAVVEQIVAELMQAERSITIASGHMRLPQIYEALVQLKTDKPDLDIRVYVDGQEFTRGVYGDYYAYPLHQAGIPVRFKYYAYRWDYTYAPQMHNKTFVIDGERLITGSYNLSYNAETKSFENMVVLSGAAFQPLIDEYEADFTRLWNTDEEGDKLATLTQSITNASLIPLVFSPMALTHPQVVALKELIEENCPAADRDSPEFDSDYKANPSRHKVCPRAE